MVISSVFFILFFIYVLYSASTVHVGRNMGLFVKNIGRLSKTQVTEQRKKWETERESVRTGGTGLSGPGTHLTPRDKAELRSEDNTEPSKAKMSFSNYLTKKVGE